jgi:hypothetical protein
LEAPGLAMLALQNTVSHMPTFALSSLDHLYASESDPHKKKKGGMGSQRIANDKAAVLRYGLKESIVGQ